MSTKLAQALRGLKRRISAPKGDGRPRAPVLTIDSPHSDSVATGLLPITGWAFAESAIASEGIVEVALGDDREWAELTNRMHVGGIDLSALWAHRCGFQAALNTFLLSNGDHRIRLRVKTPEGRVVSDAR